MVTKRVQPGVREVDCIWWSPGGWPSHDLGQDIEVEQRRIALAVEWEGSSDGYFRLVVETGVGVRECQVEMKERRKVRFTFRVIESPSVR